MGLGWGDGLLKQIKISKELGYPHSSRDIKHKERIIIIPLPEGLASGGGLLADRTGEASGDRFFSAVRTCDKAATAAAL